MKNKTCGIYVITERATQRPRYVGQSLNIEGRWGAYKNRFPQELFDYRIIQECLPAKLDFWEKYYICALKTHWTEGGENQDWGGQHWPKPEEPISPATRAKISAAQKGRVHSEEQNAKQSASMKGKNKGKVQSEETRAKISEANKGKNKGKPMSEEQKAKMSAVMKGRVRVQSEEEKSARRGKPMSEAAKSKSSAALKGRVAPNKGKRMSEEQKAKLKGRTLSEEHRAKISAAQKGRVYGPMSEEEKAKRSAAQKGRPPPNKGKPLSEEQKKKLSEAVKARLALKRAAEAAAMAALEALLFTETETILNPE